MTGVKCDSSSFLSILAKIPKEEKNTIATQPKVGHRSTSSRYLRECRVLLMLAKYPHSGCIGLGGGAQLPGE
jgi:hypothetical protein